MEIEDDNDISFHYYFSKKIFDPVVFNNKDGMEYYDTSNATNNYLNHILSKEESNIKDYFVSVISPKN